MPDEQINLRPRLSIFKDIHPELYELVSRIPPSRHNALVMQMLVRMATIDRYGGIGSFSSPKLDAPPAEWTSQGVEPSLPAPKPTTAASTSPVLSAEEPSSSASMVDQPSGSIEDLKSALGDMLMS
ncbi:hypothetical protein [Comamonas thiooxydans]|uniref:hypothetical protein n=1 Tax=Comamonas thiooxydans TaxID=363952 RepID=UPI00103F31A2|nr:hypothetical protein [Comamonas thiooxydans]